MKYSWLKKQSEGEFQKKVIVICSTGTYSTTGMQGELLCYDILIGTPVNWILLDCFIVKENSYMLPTDLRYKVCQVKKILQGRTI